MFNKDYLKQVLEKYKENFLQHWWNDEKYKWEAVKCFQDNWDARADDFADMLTHSLAKTDNLLVSAHSFSRAVLENVFAKNNPEFLREMFKELFDEKVDVYERIKNFKENSNYLLKEYGKPNENHHQTENSISIYLWLRYPDKYYIYKFGIAKRVSEVLRAGYTFKRGAYEDNIRNFYKLYDKICVELKQETGIVEMFKSQLTENFYPDPELKTLTQDVGFYISQNF